MKQTKITGSYHSHNYASPHIQKAGGQIAKQLVARRRSERIIHNFESFNIHGYDIEILIRILFQYLICLFIKGFFSQKVRDRIPF